MKFTQISPTSKTGFLVASPFVKDAPKGSRRDVCTLCSGPAWLSPSGQARLLRFPSTKVVCLNCYFSNPDRFAGVEKYMPSREELASDESPERADLLIRKFSK